MTPLRFDGTWDGWREQARVALAAGIAPDSADWIDAEDDQAGLPWGSDGPAANGPPVLRVPRAFLEWGPRVACFRDPGRWGLLYRVLWRLTHGEPRLLDVVVDPDVFRLLRMERAVRRDVHKMRAFVRFRRMGADESLCYVAWYEPDHPIVEHNADFFVRRFPSMCWAILTPDRCAWWNTRWLRFGPGVPRNMAPRHDHLEALWGTYYASTFNPARLRTAAMAAEMPRKFWRNLPEAQLIPELVRDAPGRVRRMVSEPG